LYYEFVFFFFFLTLQIVVSNSGAGDTTVPEPPHAPFPLSLMEGSAPDGGNALTVYSNVDTRNSLIPAITATGQMTVTRNSDDVIHEYVNSLVKSDRLDQNMVAMVNEALSHFYKTQVHIPFANSEATHCFSKVSTEE
jgi:hypothetical protein